MQFTLLQLLNQYKIIIPQIQRDFAQGRDSELDLRKGFVGKIKQSLETGASALNLDFVYGYSKKIIQNELAFIPIDGQQRLTTLWLLHWYVAPREFEERGREKICVFSAETRRLLGAFTYETRASSKRFCQELIAHPLPITGELLLSKWIQDASWFRASWIHDPTIVSMLNMLDTIEEECFDTTKAWMSLSKESKITFDYIDIKSDEFKLTDELYIKMNSRGKPLTPFESFKAQFSGLLSSKGTDFVQEKLVYREAEVTYQQYFSFNVDGLWMDLFWCYRKKIDFNIDTCFLNYVYYIADLLYFKSGVEGASPDVKRNFEFLNEVFSIKKNIDFLFNSLDFFSGLDNIELFFNTLFEGFSTFDVHPRDYFLRSITNTGFDVKDKVLLYAILVYCMSAQSSEPRTFDSGIPFTGLKTFTRIIRNLLLAVRQPNQSSRIEYTSNLRLPDIQDYGKFIDGFLELIAANRSKSIYEVFAESNLDGFGRENIAVEKEKAVVINGNADLQGSVFSLEEHAFIQGNTINFKLNSDGIVEKINAFYAIWNEDMDDSLVIRAFLTIDDYSVKTHDYSSLGEIWYFGSSGNWNRILTANAKDEREKVSGNLDLFLNAYLVAEGGSSNEKLQYLVDHFQTEIRNWRYYFIRYKAITKNPYIGLNLFTWADEDGFNINSLTKSGKQPLRSYHLNPYLIALKEHFETDDRVRLDWGIFRDTASLWVNGKVCLQCTSGGWKVLPIDDYTIGREVIGQFCLIEQNDGFLLSETVGKDKIEIAIDFWEDVI